MAVLAATALVVLIGLSLSDAVPPTAQRLAGHLPERVRSWPLLSFSSGWGLHFVAFSGVTFLAVQAVRTLWARFSVAGVLMLTGWGIELAQQQFSQARSYEDVDLLANTRGIALGLTAAVCLLTLRSRNGRRATAMRLLRADNPTR